MERQQGLSLVLAKAQGHGGVTLPLEMREQSPGCFYFLITLFILKWKSEGDEDDNIVSKVLFNGFMSR